jgi:transposase
LKSVTSKDLRALFEAGLATGDKASMMAAFDLLLARQDEMLARQDELLAERDALKADVEWKRLRIEAMQRVIFGRRSERLSKEDLRQLVLMYGATEAEAAVDEPSLVVREPTAVEPEEGGQTAPDAPADSPEGPKGGKGGRGGKKRRPATRMEVAASVERVVTQTPVPADQRMCSACGVEMSPIAPREHKWIDFVPARFIERIERREVLVCKSPGCRCDATTAERAEVRVVEPRVTASFLAHLVESKCDDALPIYRQCDQFARLGVKFPESTLYGHWAYVTDLLEPVADAVFGTVLDDEVCVAMDDTGLDVLDETRDAGKFRAHLWCFTGTSPLVAYRLTKTWEADEIEPWIRGTRPTAAIQVDDYGGYSALYPDEDGKQSPLVPVHRRNGCMMHVRRRFHEALKLGDKRAGFAVEQIRRLYAIEESVRGKPPDERHAVRQAKSIPVLDVFDAWVDDLRHKPSVSGHLEDALRYAHAQRAFIRRCFTDGRYEIDNGRVERAIREPALGRKNFLFTGSFAAGERLAAAYTLVQSCRGLGVSTREYLIDVIEKIAGGWPARRLAELMPHRWLAQRPAL